MVEAEWLVARRKAGASTAAELGLPTTKTPGWEFTDLAELAEADFAVPNGADPEARERADAVLNPPEAAPRVVQVDGTAVEAGLGAAPASGDRPTEPVVTTLAEAARALPRPGRPRSSVPSPRRTTPSSPATTRPGGAAPSSTCPRASAWRRPCRSPPSTTATDIAIGFRTLIVLEEDAEAEVWEQWLATDEQRAGLFNTVTELFVGPGANLHYVSAQGLGEPQLGVRHPARRGGARRDARLGRARLRLGPRQGPDGDPPRGPGLDRPRSPAPTPATATSTSTSTPPRSTRPHRPSPTSPSAGS